MPFYFLATITAAVSLFAENLILDRCYMFLVLWYYCTLTIRESILRVNGTRIRVSTFIYNKLDYFYPILYIYICTYTCNIYIATSIIGMVESTSFCLNDTCRRTSGMAKWRLFFIIQVRFELLIYFTLKYPLHETFYNNS